MCSPANLLVVHSSKLLSFYAISVSNNRIFLQLDMKPEGKLLLTVKMFVEHEGSKCRVRMMELTENLLLFL